MPVPVLAGAVAAGGASLADAAGGASLADAAGGASLADAGGEDAGSTPRDDGRAPGLGRRVPLSPRLAACCEVAMGVTMGYVLILLL